MSQRYIEACGAHGAVQAVKTLWNQFDSDAQIKKHIPDETREEAFIHLVEAELGMDLEAIDYFGVEKGKLRAIKNKINKVSRAYRKGKMSSSVAEMLYTTSAIADRNPEVKGLLEQFIHVNHKLKGRQQKHHTMFSNIVNYIRKESIMRGFEKESFIGTGVQAIRGKTVKAKADRFENDIMQAKADVANNKSGAESNLKRLTEAESKFYKEQEGQVFEEMLYLVETSIPDMMRKIEADTSIKNPRKELENRIKDLKNEDGSAISTNGMQGAVKEYLKMVDDTWKVLDSGVDAFVKSIAVGLKKTTSKGEIEKITAKLSERMKPHRVAGYFPHYTRDNTSGFVQGLMPHLEAVNQATSLRLGGHSKEAVNNALDGLKAFVESDIDSPSLDAGYLSGHAKRRSRSEDYSHNFLTVIKNYSDEINRFNFITHSNLATRQALDTVYDIWHKGEDMNGYGQSVVQFIQDMHAAQTGVKAIQNPTVDAMMRTVLGMEFVSKLGWNIRSGIRNKTQSLLNYVYFGWRANKKSDAYIKGLPSENKVDGVLKKHGDRLSIERDMEEQGFLFTEGAPQVEEALGIRGSMHKVLKYDENTGKVSFVRASGIQKVSEGVAKVAEKSAIIMQKVENSNRKRTYKTAFSIEHQRLAENYEFRNALMDGKITGTKMSSDQADAYIWNKSRNFATNMVSMLHFDYGDVSKSKLMRSPLGKILFQFQHYGFKFLELNSSIVKGAKNDILSGSMKGADVLRAYRMSMIYFLAPMIAAGLTGLDFSNIIEHDSQQRVKQLATVLTGSEEDVEAATYGRGLTAMVGGPFISDMLALGNIMGFVDLDKNELSNFLVGYQRQADLDSDEKSAEIMRIFSTALSRTYNSTLPLALQGNIGFAAQLESGVLSSQKSRKIRKKAEKTMTSILPTDDAELMKALSLLQGTSNTKKAPQIY